MTTGIIGDDVRDYLEAVRLRLADLPVAERDHQPVHPGRIVTRPVR